MGRKQRAIIDQVKWKAWGLICLKAKHLPGPLVKTKDITPEQYLLACYFIAWWGVELITWGWTSCLLLTGAGMKQGGELNYLTNLAWSSHCSESTAEGSLSQRWQCDPGRKGAAGGLPLCSCKMRCGSKPPTLSFPRSQGRQHGLGLGLEMQKRQLLAAFTPFQVSFPILVLPISWCFINTGLHFSLPATHSPF